MSETIAKANMVISHTGSQYRVNNHNLSVVANGKLDEKAEDERKSLIKSMGKRGTPNAVAKKWKAPQETPIKDTLPATCSAKKSLEEFEERKQIQMQKRQEYERKLSEQKQKDEELRKQRREEIMRRYSSNYEITEKTSCSISSNQSSRRATHDTDTRKFDDNAFLADLEELEVSRKDYETLSKSGQAALRRRSSGNNYFPRTTSNSSRTSVSDRASLFEKLEREALTSSDVLNNPTKSRKSSNM